MSKYLIELYMFVLKNRKPPFESLDQYIQYLRRPLSDVQFVNWMETATCNTKQEYIDWLIEKMANE